MKDKKRILVMTTNQAFMDSITSILDASSTQSPLFELTHCESSNRTIEVCAKAKTDDVPFALAFIDVQNPTNPDELEVIRKLWASVAELQIVLCAGSSDFSWEETIRQIGRCEGLFIQTAPFNAVEIRQLAEALTDKWTAARQIESQLHDFAAKIDSKSDQIAEFQANITSLNNELQQAKSAATEANVAHVSILEQMGHELRTPMSAILGFSETLKDSVECKISNPEDRADLLESVATIIHNGEQLLSSIDDVLEASKLERGGIELQCTTFSLFEFIADTHHAMERVAAARDLNLSVGTSSNLPDSICSDASRLKQMLVKLIANAIHFTNHGSVHMQVSREDGESNTNLVFDVLATGTAINNEDAEQLFTALASSDQTATRQFGGNGLAMAVCRNLAKMLGGDLTQAQTTPDRGCRFQIKIASQICSPDCNHRPRHTEPVSTSKLADSDLAGQTGQPLEGCRVLLAEDDIDNRRLICHILSKAGASVTAQNDGQQALESMTRALANESQFDVVLMDMQMPVMDGFESTSKMREAGYQGPIIAITAGNMDEDRKNCIDAGCNEFALRPVRACELVRMVTRSFKCPPVVA